MFKKAKEEEETSMEASYPRCTVRSSHFKISFCIQPTSELKFPRFVLICTDLFNRRKSYKYSTESVEHFLLGSMYSAARFIQNWR